MQESGVTLLIWLIPVIVVGFVVAFSAIWCFVCWLISIIGGWRRLAQHYRTSDTPNGPGLFARFLRLGISSYRRTVTVHITPAGLHLAVMPLFRLGHPPLMIPWSAVRNATPSSYRWMQAVRFDVLGPNSHQPLTTLTLPSEIATQLPAAIAPSA
jgi:hypothetical protein